MDANCVAYKAQSLISIVEILIESINANLCHNSVDVFDLQSIRSGRGLQHCDKFLSVTKQK